VSWADVTVGSDDRGWIGVDGRDAVSGFSNFASKRDARDQDEERGEETKHQSDSPIGHHRLTSGT